MICGSGCDLTPIARLRRACERTPAFAARVFTPAERAAAQALGARGYERLAGVFAAKEAVLKALGTGMRVPFADLEVAYEPAGRPAIVLSGRAQAVARELGITHWHLSIAHAGGMAMATAIAERAAAASS